MRRGLIIFLVSLAGSWAFGQNGLSFYHLKNATFQNSNFNPAYIPHGKFFVGLPAISGIGVYANNRFAYRDIIQNREEDSSNFVNISGTIKELGLRNILSVHSNISLLHIGMRIPSGAVFSFFANVRVEADVLYPRQLIEWAWKGNAKFLGDKINLNPLGVSVNWYHEYGLGLAYAPSTRIKWGVRLKYLQGVANISTPSGFGGTILSDRVNYEMRVQTKKMMLRTAGLRRLSGTTDGALNLFPPVLQAVYEALPYILSNPNKGFATDFGFEYQLNKYYAFSMAINDLGFISWKDDIQTTSLSDTTFKYSGIELDGAKNIFDGLDSLQDIFTLDTISDAYTSMIPTNIFSSVTFTPRKGTDVITTISARIVQNQIKPGFGVGIRQYFGPKLVLSASATRLPQQFVNIGAAFSATAGVAQLYVAADKVIGYNIPNMQWVEFRAGINLVFGSGNKEKSKSGGDEYKQFSNLRTESKGVTTGTFMGEKVKVKGTDGIYTEVKISEKTPAGTITPEVINDDRKLRRILSGTGKTPTNSSRFIEPKSATGKTQTNDRDKVQARSATGSTQTSASKKVKARSATGSTDTTGGRKVKTRKPSSSSGGTASKMTNRNQRRSSAGGSQKSVKKQKRNVRSATGQQKHQKPKRRKN